MTVTNPSVLELAAPRPCPCPGPIPRPRADTPPPDGEAPAGLRPRGAARAEAGLRDRVGLGLKG